MMSDPLEAFGLKTGKLKQRSGESNLKFVKRLCGSSGQKTFVKVRGDIEAFSMVYGVEEDIVRDILRCKTIHMKDSGLEGPSISSEKLREARNRGKLDQLARKEAREELASLVTAERAAQAAGAGGGGQKRERWPTDAKARKAAIKKYLLTALVEEEGRVVRISENSNLPIPEILGMLDADPELRAAEEMGLRVVLTRVEDRYLNDLSDGARVSAAQRLAALKALDSERYSEKRTVDVNHTGFSLNDADEDSEELPSVLGNLAVVETNCAEN